MTSYRIFPAIAMLCFLGACSAQKDMILADRGFEAMRTGNYIDAEKHLEKALMINPDNAYALFNLGVVYENTGRPEKAGHMYERVIALESKGTPVKGRTATDEVKDLAQIARENLNRMNPKEMELPSADSPPPQESPPVEAGDIRPPSVPKAEEGMPENEGLKEAEPAKAFPRGIYYSLQVGAYQSADLARARSEDLIKMGQDGFIREGTAKNKGILYRVYLNRYKTKEDAIREAERFRKSKLISDYVVRELKSPIREEGRVHKEAASPKVYLHIGSFTIKANAEQTVNRLKQAGLEAVFATHLVQGETWHRVLVGPYENEDMAVRTGEELKKRGFISYFRPVSDN